MRWALPTTGLMVPVGLVLTPRGNDLYPVLGPVVTARGTSNPGAMAKAIPYLV